MQCRRGYDKHVLKTGLVLSFLVIVVRRFTGSDVSQAVASMVDDLHEETRLPRA